MNPYGMIIQALKQRNYCGYFDAFIFFCFFFCLIINIDIMYFPYFEISAAL